MFDNTKVMAMALVFASSAMAGNAATVFTTGTIAGGSQFTVTGDTTVSVFDPNNAWFLGATTPASEWIWAKSLAQDANGDQLQVFGGPVTFMVNFTLSASKAASATLSGLIGLDDFGSVWLNGTEIFADNNGNNYSGMQSYGTNNSSLFTAGNNFMEFRVNNNGGFPAGLRATLEVAAVPLPASLPLLGGALLVVGAMRRRRKVA